MPLYFPGSDGAEATGDPNELTFRDGKRTVAPYLAVLMGSLDTERLTFQEAVDVINKSLVSDHVGRHFDRTIANHMRDWGN
jgi:hypothetical protein